MTSVLHYGTFESLRICYVQLKIWGVGMGLLNQNLVALISMSGLGTKLLLVDWSLQWSSGGKFPEFDSRIIWTNSPKFQSIK